MDSQIHDRLLAARERLRAAIEHSLVPEWLAQPAQRCLIDLDCALASDYSDAQARMLLAQIDALITVVDASTAPKRRGSDTDSK